jgi:hypothetical protein
MSNTDVAVHQCVTLMNPDALTPEQLRAEFVRLQGEAFAKDLQIVQLQSAALNVDRLLRKLVQMRLDGQTASLLDELDAMAGYLRELSNHANRTKH